MEQPSLTVLSGSMGGTVFIVDDSVDNILIGSDTSCSFALPGTAVDPIHARLWIDLDGITVYDTNSPRGVYVNDDRVQGQARLRNGDILWLGPPGDERSVMLQCRLPGPETTSAVAEPPPLPRAAAPVVATPPRRPDLPPDIDPTAAMMAIDLDPTVPLTPDPTHLLAPDATHLLAPDAIQPEPTVAMLPDDLELSEGIAVDTDPAATLLDEPPATIAGWDPTAGGMTSASDPPWMAGAPVSAAADPGATIPPETVVDHREMEPPPLPVAAPKAATRPASPPPEPRAPRAPEPPPVPKPRRATAAAAAVPPPRRREPAPPRDDEATARPARQGAPIGLLIGGGLLAAAAVAAAGWWMLTRGPAAPEESPVAPPPTVADARPAIPPPAAAEAEPSQPTPAPVADVPVEEELTIVPAPRAGVSPSPIPSRAPASAPPATQVAAAAPPVPAAPAPGVVAAGLVGRAEAARHAGDLDAAADLFDQALRADPQNAAATAGKAAVTSARAAARKAFMPGRTVVQTQSAKSDMAGFDTADVSVKKAPDFSGRIEFAVNPPRVKPGDNYAVQIYLVNEGKKAIKVSGVSVTTNLNGEKSARPVTSRVKEVGPTQRALLDEIPGVWPEGVTGWSAEVMVTANKGDSLKNLLTWR